MAEERVGKEDEKERIFIKGLGFCGNGIDGNLTEVHVKDGKVVRITPLRYDRKYKLEEFRPWKLEARGQTYEPPIKTLPPPLALGYKKRVYSSNRLLYPLKRVDFNPNGERNIQNRGKSGYVRISWEEALDIIVGEMKRIIGIKKVFFPTRIDHYRDRLLLFHHKICIMKKNKRES